VVRLTLRVLRV